MYSEVQVVLRFDTKTPINSDDVRAFLRGQGPGSAQPCEWCIGTVEDATDRLWTLRWQMIKAQAAMFDLGVKALNGHG